MPLFFFAHMGMFYLIDSLDVRTRLATPVCDLALSTIWLYNAYDLPLLFFSSVNSQSLSN